MGEKRSHFVELTGSDIKKLISNTDPESKKSQQSFCCQRAVFHMLVFRVIISLAERLP